MSQPRHGDTLSVWWGEHYGDTVDIALLRDLESRLMADRDATIARFITVADAAMMAVCAWESDTGASSVRTNNAMLELAKATDAYAALAEQPS